MGFIKIFDRGRSIRNGGDINEEPSDRYDKKRIEADNEVNKIMLRGGNTAKLQSI